MYKICNYLVCLLLIGFCLGASAQQPQIAYCGKSSNDLVQQLTSEGFKLKQFSDPLKAVNALSKGSALLLLADDYPHNINTVKESVLSAARRKNLRVYIEYAYPLGNWIDDDSVHVAKLERGIVSAPGLGKKLKAMDLLGINDCHYLRAKVDNPLLVLGKVAGFDRAEYGTGDIETFPLLFQQHNILVATTKLSNFKTGRYGPADSWKALWEYIMGWMTNKSDLHFSHWISDVTPAYGAAEALPEKARRNSVDKGAQWFYNGRFFVDSSWKDMWLKYQGDGTAPFGPPVPQTFLNGDGSLGILEGHASNIYWDGSEQYRYWIRNDVQGEVSFALAAAGKLLNNPGYTATARKLGKFIFEGSNFRAGPRADKSSPVYGLLGWSVTHPYVFYNDDNARSILGLIGSAAFSGTQEWDKEIVENILSNLRTSSKQGFQGGRLEQPDILKNGWQYYWNRDLVNPHPHFESWMWACYLWLYDKTGYAPLLEKTKTAIRLTMEAYPDKWNWTNGIQQERARMILPLAWLVRIENTPLHRQWLDMVVTKLLENQQSSGAIREELGGGNGMFGSTKSNREYGLHEAPLIFENGDEVADMLYTSNFAFFSLNEAANATGNAKYMEAVQRLSDFLTRIQVKSSKHKDVDGAWFRAFDYQRWDYWASNADAGWGAWSTLTGWIQSWIVATQVLVEQRQSYWDITKKTEVNKHMKEAVDVMFGNGVSKLSK
ncbi:MAG: hypothetical protein ACTHMM_20595 [Agriterribacter sp.]